jgi:hypothetical protein
MANDRSPTTNYKLPNPDFPIFWRLGIGVCDLPRRAPNYQPEDYSIAATEPDWHP